MTAGEAEASQGLLVMEYGFMYLPLIRKLAASVHRLLIQGDWSALKRRPEPINKIEGALLTGVLPVNRTAK